MKIERISDNQIKFILTESDLSERNMRLHELSYGSEKTQELFREIMEKATIECGFHTTHETPLIIEAIPVSRSSIMIIVTKVANHEDLEDRFGYPPLLGNYKNVSRSKQKKIREEAESAQPPREHTSQNENRKKTKPKVIVYELKSLEHVTSACVRISGTYIGESGLYKYLGNYYLVFENKQTSSEHDLILSTNQANILKEYGVSFSNYEISKSFLIERGETLIKQNAVNIAATCLA